MRAEHLHQWLIDDTRNDRPDATNWQKVVAIVQAAFRDGMMVKDSTWQTVTRVPKGTSIIFRVVVLVKVLWKAVTGLQNRRLTTDINAHDKMHRCWSGRGTGTVALEAKLLQQLTDMREAVLFKVFLDLQKSYDTLDWDRCLEIIAAYGVIPRTLRILRTY